MVCYLTQLTTMFYIHLVTYATTSPSYRLDCTWIQIRQCFPDQSHCCSDHSEKHFVGHQGCEYPTKVQLGMRIPMNVSHETGVTLHWAVQDTDFFDLKTNNHLGHCTLSHYHINKSQTYWYFCSTHAHNDHYGMHNAIQYTQGRYASRISSVWGSLKFIQITFTF